MRHALDRLLYALQYDLWEEGATAVQENKSYNRKNYWCPPHVACEFWKQRKPMKTWSGLLKHIREAIWTRDEV
jgi:hypothetical protein